MPKAVAPKPVRMRKTARHDVAGYRMKPNRMRMRPPVNGPVNPTRVFSYLSGLGGGGLDGNPAGSFKGAPHRLKSSSLQ